MTLAVIFDIDGTLSDPTHRLEHVRKKDWKTFFSLMADDPVHKPVRWLLNAVRDQMITEVEILLVSGRPEDYRKQTESWLKTHEISYEELFMRPSGDHRADFIVKSQILDKILETYEILFVVDDRNSVVQMWRERGLTCFQCRRDDDDVPLPQKQGHLTVMIGPSGAGKTSWLRGDKARELGIHQEQVVSSDAIRRDLCGDIRDQSRNNEVFSAFHSIIRTRLTHGLPTVADATNIRRRDRLAVVDLARPDTPVRYVIVNRPMEEKRETAGWRKDIQNDFMAKHEQIFNSNLSDILNGDKLPNVTVIDTRRVK
jgi:predicted kinase